MQAGTYIKEFVHGDLGRTHPRYESNFFVRFQSTFNMLSRCTMQRLFAILC